MNFFFFWVKISFFLLIIDHTCILTPTEFVDLSQKEEKKKEVITLVLKISNGVLFWGYCYFIYLLNYIYT
jgi:hypothetical protein